MNRPMSLLLGIFAVFATGWIGLIGGAFSQYGRLQPVEDSETGMLVPMRPNGEAEYGRQVYAANGCAYCHTQAVKGKGQGPDLDRGWGERRTVPRDYIYESPALVGLSRLGPDLSNFGSRPSATNDNWIYTFLYDPTHVSPGSTQPPYRFLFEEREIQGEPSARALRFEGPPRTLPGREIVPTSQARALAAYLRSLKRDYALPEAPMGN